MKGIYDTRFGVKRSWNIDRCSACSLIQISLPPPPDEMEALYEEYYNFRGSAVGTYTGLRSFFLQSLLYRLWIFIDGDSSFHSRTGRGRLLDVGCNEGRGLKIYQSNGFEVEGLELNKRAAEKAARAGFQVYTEDLEAFEPAKSFDVVVLSNVLEHSLQPKKMLAHVARILKPGGQVWISCPNFDSWQRSLFGRYWINWHVPFHIVHFSRDTLAGMVLESGFEIQIIRQKSPALWMAQSIIARLFARPGVPTKQMRNPFLVASLMLLIRCFFFPVLWLGNLADRGDCLIIEAQKR